MRKSEKQSEAPALGVVTMSPRSRVSTGTRAVLRFLVLGLLLAAGQAMAQISVTPITWDVVGLNHNRPLTLGPDLFPSGARVCNESGANIVADIEVDFVWEDGQGIFTDSLNADPFINLRAGSLDQFVIPGLDDGACFDAYFEVRINRATDAFFNSRPYFIQASAVGEDAFYRTPAFREIYIEQLIRQNRNSVVSLQIGQEADGSDWVPVVGGGTISLVVGQTYFLEKNTVTATGYEQLQSFVTLSNVLFRVVNVETTYGDISFNADLRIPDVPGGPHSRLYGDACLWDPDTQSPNYLSCLDTGKVGGAVKTVYQIEILSLPDDDNITLNTLIYDRSGSSFHYNTDFDDPSTLRNIEVIDPTEASITKRFIPSTIAADGVSTLRFTITNPNPVAVSGYAFLDVLPGAMVVATPANDSSTCGGIITAPPEATEILFLDGSIAANSSCTVLVNVTVPFDINETYPIELENTVALYVDDDPANPVGAPADTAEATLTVTAEPLPPLECVELVGTERVAAWDVFEDPDPVMTPSPSFEFLPGIASAVGGSGLVFSFNSTTNPPRSEWRAQVQVLNQTLAQARGTNAYYEFRLDTTGLDSVNFSLEAFRRNGGAPTTLTLDYGPLDGPLTQSITFSPVPNRPNADGIRNLIANGLMNINPNGVTVFRVYAYEASNLQQPVSLLTVLIEGEGAICQPTENNIEPPSISKLFVPASVAVGETSTLTFTLTNPNLTAPAGNLTGINFRDELPAGMQVVPGTFSDSTIDCGLGSTWDLEAENPGILLFEGGSLLAAEPNGTSCTLSVDVQSTTVGPNLNISDPIRANGNSLIGNVAIDTLNVTAAPPPAVIVKAFNPNPLLLDDLTVDSAETELRFFITNVDPAQAISNVSFVDQFPTGMEPKPATNPLVFNTANCGAGTTLSWDAVTSELTFSNGQIAAGATCEIWLDVVVDLETHDFVEDGAALFTNQTGPVTHVFNGITITGNTATDTLIVDAPIPDIALLKQVGPTANADEGPWSDFLAVAPGDHVYYKLTVENIGETVLTDIVVTDPNVSTAGCPWTAVDFELPVADVNNVPQDAHIAVCVVSHVIAAAGSLTNTATVTANPGGVSDEDSATYATTGLDLDKAVVSIAGDANKETYDALGQEIAYSFTITNTGFAPLPEPVVVIDTLIGVNWTCPALATVGPSFDNFLRPADPGADPPVAAEQIVCTGFHTVTLTDLADGSVFNSATATVGGVLSNEDNVTVNGVLDYGDAPDGDAFPGSNYGTLRANDGARHALGGPWMPDFVIPVGSLDANDTDTELDGQPTEEADGDDINGVDDELGVSLADFRDGRPDATEISCDGLGFPNSDTEFFYCAAVRVANPTQNPARVVGWVDFTRSGEFSNVCTSSDGVVSATCNRSAAAVRIGATGLADFGGACNATSLTSGATLGGPTFAGANVPAFCEGVVVLVWSYGVDVDLTAGVTYSRFRITTDDSAGFDTNPTPLGFQADGEVEDHVLDAGTIPVSVHAFESEFTSEGLTVRFSTASETHNMGFYIWGTSASGDFELLTPEMIDSTASDIVEPQTYTVTIPRSSVRSADNLVLTAVDYSGSEEMYGLFRIGGAYGELNPPDLIDWVEVRSEVGHRMAGSGRRNAAGVWRASHLGRSQTAVAADFLVEKPGMQRISYEDLLEAGFDLTGANPFQIAVTVNGSSVPRWIQPPGRAEGARPDRNQSPRPPRFGPGSAILFWGETPAQPDARYIDHLVYRVELKAAAVVEIKDHQAAVSSPSELGLETLRRADDLAHNFSNPGPDPWHMAALRSWQSSGNSFTTTFSTPAGIDLAEPARIGVDLSGLTAHSPGPDHRIRVFLNGNEVGEHVFSGWRAERIELEFPASALQAGSNTVEVRSVGFSGIPSITLLDAVELSWAARLELDGSPMLFRPLLNEGQDGVVLDGLRSMRGAQAFVRNASGLYRVPLDAHSRDLAVLSVPTSGAEEIWVSSVDGFHQPQSQGAVAADNLLDGLGDLVLIVHPAFLPLDGNEAHPLNQFAAHRQAQGWAVSMVSISDIQLHFGGGMALPQAVPEFLKAAALGSNGNQHVLLVGSDSYDYRNNLGLGSFSFIPTLYAATLAVPHTPSDGLLADLTGDGVSDLPLGRWPVRTLADLQATVDKVMDWEFNLADQRSAVWLTDERDPNLAPFRGQVERLSEMLVDGGWPAENMSQIIFEEVGSPAAARSALFDALEQGRTLTVFSGHGSPTIWSFQGILRPGDVADMGNRGLPSLVGTMACYTTYFVSPFSNTMAHRLMHGLTADGGSPDRNGAVAVHGAATLSSAQDNEVFVRNVLLAQKAGHTLGESVLMARQSAALRGMSDLVINWTLLGDPSLRLQ